MPFEGKHYEYGTVGNHDFLHQVLNVCVLICFSAPGTSSIDTTCTIWGLETGQVLGRVNLVSGHVKTQLIAHDKEVMISSLR